jgi:hypothetical protein
MEIDTRIVNKLIVNSAASGFFSGTRKTQKGSVFGLGAVYEVPASFESHVNSRRLGEIF